MKNLFLSFLLIAFVALGFGAVTPASAQRVSRPPTFLGYLSDDPGYCREKGEYYFHMTEDKYYYCSATGVPGTWMPYGSGGGASVSDIAFAGSWNGVTTIAPSKNAVYDKIASLGKADVGLANVDNTSDANKPISTATQTALDLKAEKAPDINSQTGTSYTTVCGDKAKFLTLTNASSITLTVGAGCGAKYNFAVFQGGAGQVTFVGDTGVTLVNADSHTKTRAQYSIVTVFCYLANTCVIQGDTE